MTRGTFAIFTDEVDSDSFALLTSQEFNGDMGPDMNKGKVYGKRFLDKVNDVESFDDLLYDTAQAFGYDVPDPETDQPCFFLDRIPKKDLTEKGWKVYQCFYEGVWSEEAQDYVDVEHYEDNPWKKYFNYSDFAYVKNLTKSTLILITDEDETVSLKPGDSVVLHFGDVYRPDEDVGED